MSQIISHFSFFIYFFPPLSTYFYSFVLPLILFLHRLRLVLLLLHSAISSSSSSSSSISSICFSSFSHFFYLFFFFLLSLFLLHFFYFFFFFLLHFFYLFFFLLLHPLLLHLYSRKSDGRVGVSRREYDEERNKSKSIDIREKSWRRGINVFFASFPSVVGDFNYYFFIQLWP